MGAVKVLNGTFFFCSSAETVRVLISIFSIFGWMMMTMIKGSSFLFLCGNNDCFEVYFSASVWKQWF